MSLVPSVTVRSTTVGATVIFCPTCGGDRAAELRQGRRWVRIGPVPLLPLRRDARHLTCTSCRSDHPVGSAQQLTTAELAAHLADTSRVLTAMVVRAGDPGDRALRCRAVQHVRRIEPAYDQQRLDLDLLTCNPADAAQQVEPLRDVLAIQGKELLVADLVRVALAAHIITAHQRWLIETVGTSLGLSPLHLTGIISGVAAAVEPPADLP